MNVGKLQVLFKSAVAHHRAGRLDEAEALYRQARAVAPNQFDVLHHSGLVAYQQGRLDVALGWLTRAHQLDPRSTVCEMRLALALLAAGRREEAEKHLRHVVAVQPDFGTAWENLATCLKAQDRLQEAIACHEKAVALEPQRPSAWLNFGLTLSLLGRIDEALRCHERALAADPNYAMGHFGRGQALQQSHRPAEAVEAYGRFLQANPEHHEARSFRLFCLHYLEDVSREQMFAEHVAYGRTIKPAARPPVTNSRDPARRLRVAVLSPDLRSHSCAFFLEPLVRQLPRDEFELYLYHDHIREDAVSARLRAQAAVWRNFIGRPARVVEETIRADAPDILIDLAGHTGMTSRLPLFANRLAPVQITYLGYPDTTGVPAMDYRFTDALADPPGEAERFATERLVRFAPCAWSYEPPSQAPVRTQPRGTDAPVVFGCFNNLAKITDRQLGLWARVLRETPGSRLLLKGKGFSQDEVQARYRDRFARAGIASESVELVERTPDAASHLALYHRVDVALDTFPYHGTTTTCEALWMGVPVVTLAGDRHMSRVGVSLLTAAGRSEWIAGTEDDYVRIARDLARARDAARPAELRERVRGSALLDHAEHAAQFGAALRDCWVRWCNGEEAAA